MAVIPDAKTIKIISEKPFLVGLVVSMGFNVFLVLHSFEEHKREQALNQKALEYKDERIQGLEDNLMRASEVDKASSLLINKYK